MIAESSSLVSCGWAVGLAAVSGQLWLCSCGRQWWVPGWGVLARQLWVGSFRGEVMACQL